MNKEMELNAEQLGILRRYLMRSFRPMVNTNEDPTVEELQLFDQLGLDIHQDDEIFLPRSCRNLDRLRFLLDHGANVDPDYGTALLYACGSGGGDIEAVRLLLDRGANVNGIEQPPERRHWGTPLSNAAEWDHLDIVQLLLDRGADLHAQDDRALVNSCMRNRKAMVRFLVDQGATINQNALFQARHWNQELGDGEILEILETELARYGPRPTVKSAEKKN